MSKSYVPHLSPSPVGWFLLCSVSLRILATRREQPPWHKPPSWWTAGMGGREEARGVLPPSVSSGSWGLCPRPIAEAGHVTEPEWGGRVFSHR